MTGVGMVQIKQDPENEVAPEVLATAIQRIADAVSVLFNSRLRFETVVLLVSKAAKVGLTDTHNVLIAARDLAKTYLKPPVARKP